VLAPPNHPRYNTREFIAALAPGTRTREDIDSELQADRDAWGDVR
jgi:DNA integrity scanning protein DisA with diadenylate cyclase activity